MPDQETSTAVLDKPKIDVGALNDVPSPFYYSPVNVNLAEHEKPPLNDTSQQPQQETAASSEVRQQSSYQQPVPPEQAPPNIPPEIATPPQFEGDHKGPFGKWLMLAIIAVVLLAGAGAAWYVYERNQKPALVEQPQPQTDPDSQPTPPTVSAPSIETQDDTPTIKGETSDPTAQVTVTIEGQEYLAAVGSDGTWEVVVTNALEVGTYSVEIVAVTSAGATSDTVTVELVINSQSIPTPEPEPEPEPEPDEVPNTGPESSLPNTGPSDSLYPPA